jgi:hypothetical protein
MVIAQVNAERLFNRLEQLPGIFADFIGTVQVLCIKESHSFGLHHSIRSFF